MESTLRGLYSLHESTFASMETGGCASRVLTLGRSDRNRGGEPLDIQNIARVRGPVSKRGGRIGQ